MRDLLSERPLTENGRGANLFLKPDLIQHPACPLTPGGSCTAVTIPHVGIVLLPETEPELPIDLTVKPPESYRVTTVETDSTTMTTEHDSTDSSTEGDTHGL